MSASSEALIQAPPRSLPRIGEDWLSVIIGLAIFVFALAGLANVDLIGWTVTTSVWGNLGQALGPVSKAYAALGGFGALVATYAALLIVLTAAAVALGAEARKFALAFTAVFWIAYASWIAGNMPISPRSPRPSCRSSASAGRSSSPTKAPISSP